MEGIENERRIPMSGTSRTSSCICGAVQLSITGEPVAMAYCHCESCRGWLGAPVHASSLWPASNVQVDRGDDLLETFKRTEGSGSRNGLPKYEDFDPRLGGTGERVPE
jgi:hypothetical protein